LTMLSRLKQLCNHPALFLKEPHGPAEQLVARSDKLSGIVSMAGNIAENGEQCIIRHLSLYDLMNAHISNIK